MSRRGVPRVIVEVLEGYWDDISRDAVMGIAEELWVHAYSTWGKGDIPGPDHDWYDVVPEVPSAAFQAADVIGRSLEALNRLPLGEIAWEARGYVTTAHGVCTVPNRATGEFAQGIGRALARECLGDGNLLGFPHKVMSSFEVSFDGRYLTWTPREPEKTGGRDLALATNPAGLTKKGERMYKAVERGYRAAGDARAKEIAARTVFASAKHGVKGLVRNPQGLAVCELVVTPDDEVGRVVAIDGNEAQVVHEDRVEGRGPWYWGVQQLLDPHEDAKLEYMRAVDRLAPPDRGVRNPGPMTKQGKHGTLYRFAVDYSPGDGEKFTWHTWAYDSEHAVSRFLDDPMDWGEVLGVRRVTG